MTSISELAAKILQAVILDDPAKFQRDFGHRIVLAEIVEADEQERWELLDAVRERLLLISGDRSSQTPKVAAAFATCIQMLQHLEFSRD